MALPLSKNKIRDTTQPLFSASENFVAGDLPTASNAPTAEVA